MLYSMTGFGEAHHQDNGVTVAVEVRTINSRYFKVSIRLSDTHTLLEPQVESVLREQFRRGTAQVSVRVDRAKTMDDFRINQLALASYREQLDELHTAWHLTESITLERLLGLPGVVEESPMSRVDPKADWELVKTTLLEAMAHLAEMRADEGKAMAADLTNNIDLIAQELAAIERRAPLVADAYRSRLEERINRTLAEHGVTVDASDVLREISIFSERCDISEETVRLRSHLDQFRSIMELPESSGRKLDFLSQEMFRETNTIGAKANDVEISRHVIELKAAIERIREMIQNIE